VRNPRQESNHHAKGYPIGPKNPWRTCLRSVIFSPKHNGPFQGHQYFSKRIYKLLYMKIRNIAEPLFSPSLSLFYFFLLNPSICKAIHRQKINFMIHIYTQVSSQKKGGVCLSWYMYVLVCRILNSTLYKKKINI
jgi:hypothetical protein